MALSAQYSGLPDDEERFAIRTANRTDEAYLIKLAQMIESHKAHIAKLELTCSEVQNRIKLRNSRIAPHCYLPNEIISHIFSFVEYDPYRVFSTRSHIGNVVRSHTGSHVSAEEWLLRTPINVSRVCRRWRQTALTTPSLWGGLIVDMGKKWPVQMMEHWFQLARTLPVHVTIWKEDSQSSDFKESIQLVAGVLKRYRSLVGSVTIYVQSDPDPFGTFVPLHDQDISIIFNALDATTDSPSPSLQSINIRSMDAEVKYNNRYPLLPVFPPHLLSNLTRLHIRGFYSSISFFSCIPSNLTTLKLDAPGHVFTGTNERLQIDILRLLSSLPKLERLRLTGRYPNLTGHQRDPVELPNLKRLTISGGHATTHLPFIQAPNLASFKLKGGHCWKNRDNFTPIIQWQIVNPLISGFLEKNGSTISLFTVTKVGAAVNWNTLSAWVRHMEALKRLIVTPEANELGYPETFMEKDVPCYQNAGALEWRLRA